MVWYCSVVGGLKYDASWDCSGSPESKAAYIQAMKHLNDEDDVDGEATSNNVGMQEENQDDELPSKVLGMYVLLADDAMPG